MRVVADASPLIALADIGHLDALRLLYREVVVPPAVAAEVFSAASRPRPSWVRLQSPGPVPAEVVAAGLHRGESEGIALALQLGADLLLIDDRDGRRLAARLGIRIAGTVGVVVKAKQRGHVAAVRPILDQLRGAGFWLGQDVYELALRNAGE